MSACARTLRRLCVPCLCALRSLCLPAGAAAQERGVEVDAGSVITVPLPIPVTLAAAGASPHELSYVITPASGVRSFGPLRGTHRWADGDAALLPVTLMLPRRLAAGPFEAARVRLTAVGRDGPLSAELGADVIVRVRHALALTLRASSPRVSPAGEVTLSYEIENRGNAADRVRILPKASAGLEVAVSAAFSLAPFERREGRVSVHAAPDARTGQRGFVRLMASGEGSGAVATARLDVMRVPGSSGRISLPATLFVGSSVSGGEMLGSGHNVLSIHGSGTLGPETRVRYAFRRLPREGASPVFGGNPFGPRLELGLEHGPWSVGGGDLSVPTSSLAGFFFQGSGAEAGWKAGAISAGAMVARPRLGDRVMSGHLGLVRASARTGVGTLGFTLADVAVSSTPLATSSSATQTAVGASFASSETATADSSSGRLRAGIVRYDWESDSGHWISIDAGVMRVSEGTARARTGPGADLKYVFRGTRTTLNARARTLPATTPTIRLPARELRISGSRLLAGRFSLLSSLYSESTPLLSSEPVAISRVAGLSQVRSGTALHTDSLLPSVRGAEVGIRYAGAGVRFDLTATDRRSTGVSGLGSGHRRALRAGFGAGVGALRFDGIAEVGSSRQDSLRAPAEYVQLGINWLGSGGWARLALRHTSDLLVPATTEADLSGAIRLLPALELNGTATAELNGSIGGDRFTARLGARVEVASGFSVFVGAESLPADGLAFDGRGTSRLKFSLGVQRGLAVPLPLRRGPAVEGVVFEDLDGNGRRDADEPGVSGVILTLGGERSFSDGRGRFEFGERQPQGIVRIDPTTLAPGLVAPFDSYVSDSRYVEIPVVRAASLEVEVYLDRNGNGRRDGGEAALPGARVQLRNARGIVWDARAGAGGRVGFTAIRPGSYTLSVDPRSLPAGATAPPPRPEELGGGSRAFDRIGILYHPRPVRFSGE